MTADRCTNYKLTRRRVLNAGIAALAAASPASAFPQAEDPPFRTPTEPANAPMGVGKGIQPGRVAWAHEPKVAYWDGKTGNWWDDANTDPRIVDTMVHGSLRSLTGERTDKDTWRALFGYFKQTRRLGGGEGYRVGEKIAIKVNSNQDRPGAWRFGAGMPSPQVLYSLVDQLITVAGVPGQDITLYDASRYIGDPIYNRIRANPDPNFQAVKFVASQRMAGNGRAAAVPDKTNPVRFSRAGRTGGLSSAMRHRGEIPGECGAIAGARSDGRHADRKKPVRLGILRRPRLHSRAAAQLSRRGICRWVPTTAWWT